MNKYNLSFIEDNDLFDHVKETVKKYRFDIDLKKFNKNRVDPIKFTFDSKVYRMNYRETIRREIVRQFNKSNTNQIGYFHQNIFNFIGKKLQNGWHVPKKEWDVVNEEKNIFVEMKNKFNTMNSSSSEQTMKKMQKKLIENDKATCYLVEVISKKSINKNWVKTIGNIKFNHNKIRRISIDKFYQIATGSLYSFKKLCDTLPIVLDDVMKDFEVHSVENEVFNELKENNDDILKSIFLLAFKGYEGF